MDDADLGAIRQIGLVEELLELAQRFSRAHPDQVELIAIISRGGDRNSRFAGGSCCRACPADAVRRHLDAQSTAADYRAVLVEGDQLAANLAQFNLIADLER